MINEANSEIVAGMAKELIDHCESKGENWKKAYYRFYSCDGDTKANASIEFENEASLISAVGNREFFKRIGDLGERLFASLSKPRGLLLLIVDSKFNLDVKFEFEEFDRWRITKLDGGSGIPAGLYYEVFGTGENCSSR